MAETTLEIPTYKKKTWKVLRHLTKSPLLLLSVLMLIAFVVAALFPGWLAPMDPHKQVLTARLQPPGYVGDNGQTYWLGSDHLGRDILSRLIHGARASLLIGLAATLVSALGGTFVGLLAGYKGGRLDDLLMRTADVQLAFPFFLLAITVSAVLGSSVLIVVLILGLGNWVSYARVVRSEVLELRERSFVLAAKALGFTTQRILFRHILPNSLPSIIVLVTFNIAFAIVMEAGLSFLGLGIPTIYSSWGDMLSNGRQYVDTAWWLSTFPGLSIFLVSLSINLVGDYLRESIDPYMKRGL